MEIAEFPTHHASVQLYFKTNDDDSTDHGIFRCDNDKMEECMFNDDGNHTSGVTTGVLVELWSFGGRARELQCVQL